MPVFDIVKMETRVTSMIAWMAGIQSAITDFLPGRITRTKFEAVALELEQQDYQTYRAIQKAIPTAVYRAFNFYPIAAVRASGLVTFTTNEINAFDVLIAKGTKVATQNSITVAEKVYETTEDVTLLAGETTVAVPVTCSVSGSIGNVAASKITVIKTTISDIDSVNNLTALTNGSDTENESSRAIRFDKYITTLARGTDKAIEYGALTSALYDGNGDVTEQVTQALVLDDLAQGQAGFVDVFIFNGSGGTTQPMIDRTQEIVDGYIDDDNVKIPGYAAAGIVTTVRAATEIAADVTISIEKHEGYDAAEMETKAIEAIGTYLQSLSVGDELIANELIERVMALSGVYDVILTSPATNIDAQIVEDPTFTGTGLDDATSSGAFTGTGRMPFLVVIDATGGTDTFKWSKNGGVTWIQTGVSMVAATPILLESGVYIEFAAATGHTLDDQWEVVASSACLFVAGTIDVTVA